MAEKKIKKAFNLDMLKMIEKRDECIVDYANLPEQIKNTVRVDFVCSCRLSQCLIQVLIVRNVV
jgi:hypothetical protein